MLEGAGFEVVDLGIDVPPEKFIQSAKENGAQIIGMSALLTTTMMQMQTTVQKIKAEGLKVKTVIGGAPVTAEFAKQIGADGYAPDAASAVSTIKEVLTVRKLICFVAPQLRRCSAPGKCPSLLSFCAPCIWSFLRNHRSGYFLRDHQVLK